MTWVTSSSDMTPEPTGPQNLVSANRAITCAFLLFGEPVAGLRRVERDVPGLLLRDPLQQFGEHRVALLLGHPQVGGVRRPLVRGAPGHVHGDEVVADEPADQRLLDRVEAVLPAELERGWP